jgi:site-specific DNA recombinase
LERLSNADEGFNQNISTIFEATSKSHELFKSSDIEEKRRIISLLFPNLSMDAEKLVFVVRKPFDMFLNLTDRQEWLCACIFLLTFYTAPRTLIYKALPVD